MKQKLRVVCLAATQEKGGSEMNTPVAQVLDRKGREVETIAPTETVYNAVKRMEEKGIGCLVVLGKSGRIAGILSERDCIRKAFLPDGQEPHKLLVKDVMTKKVVYVTSDTTVDDCMALITQKRIRNLPVIEADKLAGNISIGDLVKFVSHEQVLMNRKKKKYIEGSL